MEFTKAIKEMEKGRKITRPKWSGYLFLDVDGNIKYSGKNHYEYKFWSMDILESDWRKKMDGRVDFESTEVKQARIEALMDANASHLKRLYYLEEIIDGQHKAFKKMADNYAHEMDETRKALDKIVKHIPRIEAKVIDLAEKFYKTELSGLTKAVQDLMKSSAVAKIEEKKPKLEAVAEPYKFTPTETKEMEETREKYNTRLEMKAKSKEKPEKVPKNVRKIGKKD